MQPDTAEADPAATFDRVLFLRHLAIFAGAVFAYVQRSALEIGWSVLGIVTASALLNFACSFVHRRTGLERSVEVASSVVGVACWTALAALTGGAGSPFLAGLWLEIILAAMLFALSGIVAVTLFSIVGISFLEVGIGPRSPSATLALQSGFLAGMGGLAYWVTRAALTRQATLEQQRDALDARLQALADELEQEREVGRVGESVARLAHGLKNAVHSLRGFAALIEPTARREGGSAALEGLRAAIDDLEALARLTLAPESASGEGHKERCDAGQAVERAVHEVSLAHPGVAWQVQAPPGERAVAIGAEALHEVLVVLLRNAVEAMSGEGEGAVRIGTERQQLCIRVTDTGPGIADADRSRIFEPGFTTKPKGSGYGLFIARRVLEAVGGSLAASSAAAGGTTMEVVLPLLDG